MAKLSCIITYEFTKDAATVFIPSDNFNFWSSWTKKLSTATIKSSVCLLVKEPFILFLLTIDNLSNNSFNASVATLSPLVKYLNGKVLVAVVPYVATVLQ